jgi:hypothetical protein
MVQITSRRFSPFSPASYISGGELWGWKSPESPINREKRGIMGNQENSLSLERMGCDQ